MSADDDATRSVLDVTADAAAAGRLWLMVLGEGTATGHALPEDGEVTIGRATDCDVRVNDPSVSRVHAILHTTGAALRIEDLGVKNGVRVRDRRLAAREVAAIEPGEVIQLGNVLVLVQHGSLYLPPSRGGAYSSARKLPALERAPARSAWRQSGVVVKDAAMQRVLKLVERVAPSSIHVLLLGETGVGKEVVAAAIHHASARSDRPFVPIHCAALAPTVLESELFGYERGAFTGATQAKPGLLETAEGGTVLLDEIGELSTEMQVKLLRVLEDKRVQRIGSVAPRPADVRFVAATNRDLKADVASGKFRKDLYYRLDGISILIPPLRERVADIEPLARAFVTHEVTPVAISLLERYHWPGNVRELRNVMERAALLAGDATIDVEHLPADIATPTSAAGAAPAAATEHGPAPLSSAVEALERQRIVDALERCSGNQTRAAKMLGISRRMLITRLDAYGIPRPRKA